ncbi:MAG TPA: hypothetical protein VFD43_03650, partial [Planctomycetota bacterium]|nr:hypothetical protein [Planctomycetota bacterium]
MTAPASVRSPARFAALALLVSALAAPLAAAQALGPTGQDLNRALGVRAGAAARVELVATRTGRVLAALDTGAVRGVLVLEPASVRGEGYRLLAEQADGSYVELAPGPTRTLRGELL